MDNLVCSAWEAVEGRVPEPVVADVEEALVAQDADARIAFVVSVI